MGLLLRGAFVWETEWIDYRNMLHGHSHVALLGWLYLGVFILIHAKLLPAKKKKRQIYIWLFWLTQFSVVGMAIAFPLQGYATYSISFSSLHILLSYIFCINVWKDHNRENYATSILLKTALILLFVSTIGVGLVAYVMSSGSGGGILYQLAIQFYLHLQFNGWLLFAVLALFFHRFGAHLKIGESKFNRFYQLLLLGNLLSYALVIYWGYRWEVTYYVNAVAVVLQFIALIIISDPIRKRWIQLKAKLSSSQTTLLKLFILVFLTRTLFQLALVVPEMAEIAVLLRLFIIGFIHLNMLGFVTAYLWLEYISAYKTQGGNLLQSGVVLLIVGFLSTELIMFLQGFYYWQELGKLPFFHEMLFYGSCILPISVFTFLIYIINNNQKKIGKKNIKNMT